MPGPEDNQVSPADAPLPPPPSSTDPENPDPPPQQPPAPPPQQGAGCCKNRSLLEKCLFVFLLIVFLLFVAFLIGFILLYYWKGEPRAYCTKDSCVAAASRVNRFIDRTVSPCDDFYKYACGNWMQDSLIPDDQSEVTIYSDMREDVQVTLKKVLEEETPASDPSAFQKTRDFYKSCVDEDRIEAVGTEPFDKVVEDIGKWPSLDPSWNDTEFDLVDLMLAVSKAGSSVLPILVAHIKPDVQDGSVRTIFVEQGGLALGSRDLYLQGRSSRAVLSYQRMLTRLLTQLGANEEDAKKDAQEIVDLEIQLANISAPKEDKHGKTYKPTTIEELEAKYPEFDWVTYINGLLQYGGAPPQVTRAERIYIGNMTFFDKLFPILDKTSERVLANYLMSSLRSHAHHLTADYRQIVEDFEKEIKGTKTTRARWQYCVELTDKLFPEVTGRLFIKSAFGKEEKDYVETLVGNLKASFMDMIQQTEWMSAGSKNTAIDKVRALKARIGYPNYLMDDRYLETRYADYNMSKEAFFQNMLRVHYLHNLEKVASLRESVDRNRWAFSAATVRAYYDHKNNEIVFPAGFVQPTIYDVTYPRSMNYGGVGSFIGREIAHGFGDKGRKFDKEGRARDWWTADDVTNYAMKAECMVDHYSCFRWKPASMNIDGLRTLEENVADNGGLKQSYRAYRRWVETQGIEERFLPGLNLTHNQLFFISFAQLWCTNDRDDYKIHKIQTDIFAPAPFRVIGTLQNFEDFAEAFSCPVGSRMNPEKKCKVW